MIRRRVFAMPTQQISISCPPHTAPVLSSYTLGRERWRHSAFEGTKLTCRMEAAREERNVINQPPSPTTHTGSGAMNWLSHQQEHPVLPTTAAHAEPYVFPHISKHAPKPPRQEGADVEPVVGAPSASGGLPRQLQQGQLLQEVS